MEKQFKILQKLTISQRQEFEKDLLEVYSLAYEQLNGKMEKLKDVTVNMKLQDEVFLKVTFEFDPAFGKNGKGRITALSRYPNKLAYEAAVAADDEAKPKNKIGSD